MPRPAAEPPPPAAQRVLVIDRPGAVQTEIRVGNIGLPRKNPDYLALDLAIKILGGEGGNRLHRVLRSERGLTYGASADANALKDGGDIVADTDTRSETTGEALRLIVDGVLAHAARARLGSRACRRAGVSDGQLPAHHRNPERDRAAGPERRVLRPGSRTSCRRSGSASTPSRPDDIQRVARQYLHPDKLSIVLVGDATIFAKQLPGAGLRQFERIPLADLDLASVDFRRHPDAGRLPPDDAAGLAVVPGARYVRASLQTAAPAPRSALGEEAARQLVARAVAAKGGAEKLRGIKTVYAEATIAVNLPGQNPVNLDTRTSIRYPGAFRMDAATPAGPLTQVFNNGEFWVHDARGTREMQDSVAEDMRANMQRDSIGLLLGLLDRKVSATRIADIRIAGRAMPAIEVAECRRWRRSPSSSIR